MAIVIIAALLVLSPQSPSRAPLSSTVVEIPIRECPALVLTRLGGLGTEAKSGVVVALWDSGVIVRAESPARPWGSHLVGQLKASDLNAVLEEAKDSRVWNMRSMVVLDAPEDRLVIRRAHDRIGWAETPGLNSTPELERLRQRLFALPIQQRRRIVGPIDERWNCPPTTWKS